MLHRSLTSLSDVVDWGLCIGCGACAYACKSGGVRMVHVESEGFRPVFEDVACRQCTACLEICPGAHVDGNLNIGTLPKQIEADHEFGPTLEIWEGWASDPEVRFRGSSGGLLSALSLYCLEAGGFDGVIHAGMDPAQPWMNRNHVSRDREAIMARAGSRYAPSAPCAALGDIPADEMHVFIGKPCDTAAVSELCRRDPQLDRRIGLVLTFFCAGTPNTRGTLDLMESLEVPASGNVSAVHYRGEGWPGNFRVVSHDRHEKTTMSYEESWGKLT
ncbi:MAG: Coenzyme F420 hydrogenase/dehydrogenase, beta subunit C-terminal domain, partial [Acidobacteria bacterium]|nr:Coenzyme F420 hydrogenase/dehydrogenase, beta subunit C-terminal domain [Acidobacteriota bacterium]